jgi:hypothetical protein
MMSTPLSISPNDPMNPDKTRFTLERNAFGKLILTTESGVRFESVVPVRAFPIQSPEVGISIVNTDSEEVGWVDNLVDLLEPAQSLIRQELAAREFMPVIAQIVAVSSFSTPCTWTVETDRGRTEFVLRGDEDIRRIGKDNALLIADNHGIQYLVRDQFALNTASKKVLDRFL